MVNETGEERQAVMVETSEFSKANGVKVFYDEPGIKLDFKSVSVNRPGLVFAGFEEYFAESRIQVCGSAEIAYLNSLPKEARCSAPQTAHDTTLHNSSALSQSRLRKQCPEPLPRIHNPPAHSPLFPR